MDGDCTDTLDYEDQGIIKMLNIHETCVSEAIPEKYTTCMEEIY